jgi:hypothetical protein
MTFPDFGHDLNCLLDLDAAQSETSGLPTLLRALVRRLQCPNGGLVGDADYGYDIVGEIGDDIDLSDAARIASNIDSEFQKDERVTGSVTTAALVPGPTGGIYALTTNTTVQTAAGPFSLVLSISNIVSLLNGGVVTPAPNLSAQAFFNLPITPFVSNPNPGGDMLIRFAITNAASQSSATSVPAGAVVVRAMLDMVSTDLTTPVAFSGGSTIAIGRTGSANLLAAPGDFDATTSGNVYDALDPVAWGGSPLPVLITIAGAPAAGAGTIVIEYLPPTAIGA